MCGSAAICWPDGYTAALRIVWRRKQNQKENMREKILKHNPQQIFQLTQGFSSVEFSLKTTMI